MQKVKVDHFTHEGPLPLLHLLRLGPPTTHDKRMLALIAMTVGIELRDANATPTTIAVSDVEMTGASANAILRV